MARAELRKSDLTSRQKHLVERIQHMRYGQIRNLIVCDGDPVFVPGLTDVDRSVNFDAHDESHPSIDRDDMVLKAKVVHLLERLKAIDLGLVCVIHVAGGLPNAMTIRDVTDDLGCAVGFVASPTRPPVRHAAVDKIERR